MSVRSGSFAPFTGIDLPLGDRRDGKVRTSWSCGTTTDGARRRLIVTTDRLSAFDRVVAGVTYKGQILNQLSAWWFERTTDIVANHVLSLPDPNALLARSAVPLPVEVVVRGHITGVTDTSLWGMYQNGARTMYGYTFPDGLRKNMALPERIVTPTTKAVDAGHDVPLSCSEVVEHGLVPSGLWDRVVETALALFDRGVAVGRAAGLVLADTKYEFGVTDAGELLLIDEVHTPDSSRWWVAEPSGGACSDTSTDGEPESLDKEVVRRAFAAIGYRGDGPTPDLPDEVWAATTARYVMAFERLTGGSFRPGTYPVGPRLTDHLTEAGLL